MTARSPKVAGDAIQVLFNAPGDQPTMRRARLPVPTTSIPGRRKFRARWKAVPRSERVQNFQGRPAGDLILRGRSEPLRAYEPLPSRRQR
jgi:hypothetical protein